MVISTKILSVYSKYTESSKGDLSIFKDCITHKIVNRDNLQSSILYLQNLVCVNREASIIVKIRK